MKELVTFRKYLTEGVINEGKSPKDVFKIAITNLLSNSPSKISRDDWRAEYLRIHDLEGEEFIDLSTRQWGELNYHLEWFSHMYNNGTYKEVDEFLNNYDDLI
jgi:hypothetical protein